MAFPTQTNGSLNGLDTSRFLHVIKAIVEGFQHDRTRLMDIVLAVHQRYGSVSEEAMGAIAETLGIQQVEVQDMVSFYAFLNKVPKGRFQIKLSRTPVSLMKGAEAVAKAFSEATGAPIEGVSPDGRFSLEWTSDTGMSDQEPAALINNSVLTALTPTDVPGIVSSLKGLGADVPYSVFPTALPRSAVKLGLVQKGPIIFRDDGRPGDAIRAAIKVAPDTIIDEITKSNLRGRGGAGFPTGMKWKSCSQSPGAMRYVICNADEGEPGTFKDRVLLTINPDLVFEGMTVAAFAVGAGEGIVYLRGEYSYLLDSLQNVLERRRKEGLLGKNICGTPGFNFDIRIQLGAGAYVCGEESALIESMEGKRGAPRDRPPFPTQCGYRGLPTALDNVETFACAARIMEHGADWFASFGTKESTGTKLLSVSGDCQWPGVYEVPFGITLKEVLDLVGAPDAAFVQMGGPSGSCLEPKDFDRRITTREDLTTGGSVIVFGPERDPLAVAHEFVKFFAEESCGWCDPCRIGTTLLARQMDKVVAGRATKADLDAMVSLANTVKRMSRCGLGQTAPNPILTTLRSFPKIFEAKLSKEEFVPAVTLEEALAEAVQVQGRQPISEEV